jgi:hypothetical protein
MWSFGPNEARRIHQRVLSVLGEHSDPRFHQRQQLLLEWLPHVEPFILAGAGHLLHVEQPTQLATALSSSFSPFIGYSDVGRWGALFRTSMGIIPRDQEGLGGGDSMVPVI